jgi:uncharacterized membrane protein
MRQDDGQTATEDAMIVLVLGIALWWAAHLFKRFAPEPRARLGEAGKGLVAVALVVSIVLMVLGYRAAPFLPVWSPPGVMVHLNNLLMFLAVYLFAASGLKTAITARIRHPQLAGVKTWAVAHLLVNGDLAAILLFGGLLGWAVAEVIVINRAEPDWPPPPPAPARKEVIAVAGALVATLVIGLIHGWLGVWPFG